MKKIFGLFFHFTLFSLFAVSLLPAQDFFWEAAEQFMPRQGKFPVSAFSENLSVIAWQEVSPNRNPQIAAAGFINIHMAVKEAGNNWQQRGIVAGPYVYSGTEPSITNLVIDNRDRIIIAAAAGSTEIEVLISDNNGVSFSRRMLNMGAENSVAPRIFVRADGGYLLFVTRGSLQSMSIFYSRSNDGITWSPFVLFTTESNLALNFLPTHASIGRRDFVFFQSLVMELDTMSTFQLFYKTSDDGGRSWSQVRRFTTFNDPVIQTQSVVNNFDNQRPHVIRHGNNLLLVWERRYANQSPGIYCATINANGNIVGNVERINNIEAYCNNPIAFIRGETPTVVWFDNRNRNNSVVLAQRNFLGWQNHVLSSATMDVSFARPVVTDAGTFIFWQTNVRDTGSIYVLAPDHSVDSPRLTALNFVPARANRSERPRVTWNIPADTSGIAGFSWSWSQDINVVPPQEVMINNIGNTTNLNLENNADKDGSWYFSVRAYDRAGNWSAPSRIEFFRKTTPPPALTINRPQLDDNDFMLSNNFNLSWQPSTDPFFAGYTWNLQYMGANANMIVSAPPASITGTGTSVSYVNQDNGNWAFTVAAIDQAGNIGPPSTLTFAANKFIPYTAINFVEAQQDAQGILSIRLLGRGFTTNGTITSIVLEYDGEQHIAQGYSIVSDREIGGIVFENIGEGNYRLRIEHSTRGWHTAAPFIATKRTGTVKFGDYTQEWISTWNIQSYGKLIFNPITALIVMLIVFGSLGLITIVRGLSGAIAESTAIRQEAIAIITGDFMPMEKKQKTVKIEKRSRGLTFKLASFTIALVLLVVIMISIPMYINMTSTQRHTLLKSLQDRSSVLLEGIVSTTRTAMPMAIQSAGEYGILEMMTLPSQSSAIVEANYITIAGFGIGSIHNDHVWVSNDPTILSKIDTTELRPGISRFSDSETGITLIDLLEDVSAEINSSAQEKASAISQNIRDRVQEAQAIPSGEANMQRIMDIQTTINHLEVQLTEILSQVAGGIRSYPHFSTDRIDNNVREFIFYKPVMYRQGTDNNFFRGYVFLEVSLDTIIRDLFREQMLLLRTILIVAFIAMLIGAVGAFILSNLIVMPIKKLVSHIQIIRDTDDKSKLAGVDINIKTNDELAVLGNTINDMTHGLVKAALAASDLSIGKEIQKKFIPLEVDSQGNKLTSGFKKTPNLNFFGYYEGAKGVSGDYFDYRDLDGRYYAIIKCDVAGKGIPAALIMIQVATMFLNYFKQWKPNQKGMQIEEVVYQINEFIETLAFKGRFAAFTLCLFDSETGIVRFCNAGDNLVNYYDVSEGTIKTITLPTTPATGVLPNFMIESTGGYKVNTLTIDKGDILLLYTDGIEEAKRKFRNFEFKEILCTDGPVDTPHENHLCGQADEEMSPERVKDIINAVMAREVYTLHKYHNAEVGDLQFDFSTCEGSVENVIMAMVSVEKMFRCYKPPYAGEDSKVLVDKKVDEFLKNHFLQYRRYCSHTKEHPENPAYMYYTHIMEDEQYDDLTILGIKRKE